MIEVLKIEANIPLHAFFHCFPESWMLVFVLEKNTMRVKREYSRKMEVVWDKQLFRKL